MAGSQIIVKVRFLGGGSRIPWEFDKGITAGDLYWLDSTRHGTVAYTLKVPQCLSEDITEYITGQYGWIRTIFDYLPESDLRNVAITRKEWYKIVKTVRENRTQLYWLFWSYLSGLRMEFYIRHFIIRRMESRPKFCIIFGWTKIPERNLTDAFMPVMYQGSSLLLVSTPRVLGSCVSPERGHCHLGRVAPAFSCITIPDIPGVTVHQFTVSIKQFGKIRSDLQLNWNILQRNIGIKKDEIVKGMVVFVLDELSNSHLLRDLVCFIMNEQNHKIAFAGVCQVYPYLLQAEVKERENLLIGYVFCGKNVEVTSCILDANLKETSSTIAKMRRATKDADENITLMFSASDPDLPEGSWYEGYRQVTQEFHKQFHNTPLIGCFGVYTLGSTSFSDKPDYSEPHLDMHTKNTVLFHLAIRFEKGGEKKVSPEED